VAALLAAAEQLARGARPARSVLFIAFTGEESGLLGSAHFVAHSTIAPDTMIAMINMDMVGRLNTSPLIVYGVDTAAEWRPLLERAGRAASTELVFRGEGYGPSDHTSFYARDIPVLHFFTNVHGDYHRPSDDWDRIDVAGIAKVAVIVSDVATAVADRRPLLTLQRGAGQPPSAGGSRSAGYGAYLGSVPDFTPVARGVKLSGVTPGSPADKAGIRAGDIIVGMDSTVIADLQAMTDALSAHKPGDAVTVKLLRAGTEVSVSVTLGTRAAR
jgi:membrane-associated protease RseP (regulator of RpoE activity)